MARVLSFGRGFVADDPERQGERRAEFHQWRRVRAARFAEHGIVLSLGAWGAENRRRAMAW